MGKLIRRIEYDFPVEHKRQESGVIIKHDLFKATRQVCFNTGDSCWPLELVSGTLTLLRYKDRIFGITAKHVAKTEYITYPWDQISVGVQQSGEVSAHLKLLYAKGIAAHAHNEEDNGYAARDFVVLEFANPKQDVDCYHIYDETLCTFDFSDMVRVQGYSKHNSKLEVTANSVHSYDVPLDMTLKIGVSSSGDPSLNNCFGEGLTKAEMEDLGCLSGLSGAPVYNKTKNGLCGIVVRGGFSQSGDINVWFIDFEHVLQLLNAHINDSNNLVYNARTITN